MIPDIVPLIVAGLAGDSQQVLTCAQHIAEQLVRAGQQREANRIYQATGDIPRTTRLATLDSQQPAQPLQCVGCSLDLRGRCQCPPAATEQPTVAAVALVAAVATPPKPGTHCPFSDEAGQLCTRNECSAVCFAVLPDLGQ